LSRKTADLVVVGGGLMGLSTAVHAARAGLAVVVLERCWPGRHASGANAGGVRSLNRHDAEIPLARAALRRWHELPELVGDTGGFVASGQVRVAEDETQAASLEARVARLEAMGYAHERWLDAAELSHRIPALARHCTGAILVEDDGHADPHRTTRAFASSARQQGVELRSDWPVRSLAPKATTITVEGDAGSIEAPMVVNAAGARRAGLAAGLGDAVPLRAAGRKLSFKQLATGQVVVGGGFEGRADPASGRSTLDHGALATNAANASSLFPEPLRHARILRAWAGIEGMLEDGLPVIDRSPAHQGLAHAFGFSAHGFALSPLVGRLVTDLLLDRPCKFDLEPFRLDRFAKT